MSPDALKLREHIDFIKGQSVGKKIVLWKESYENAGITSPGMTDAVLYTKVKKILGELEKEGYLQIIDDSFQTCETIEVELRQTFDAGSDEKIIRDEKEHYNTKPAAAIKGLYHINQEFIKELEQPGESKEAKLQYYRLSGTLREILQVAGSDMLIAYDDLLECILSGINKKIYIRGLSDDEEEGIGTRVFFITGNGGVGKTTLLALAAIYTAKNTDTDVYVTQIKANNPKDFAERIMDEVSQSKDAMLFVDNPYDNAADTRYLIEYAREKKNVRIVFSERFNRLELMYETASLMSIANIAGAVVVENQRDSKKSSRESIYLKFVRIENTKIFVLKKEWKRKVVQEMLAYILPADMELQDERLQNILREISYAASPCEILLQACLQYNDMLQEEGGLLEAKIPFQFDWDEWKKIFSGSTDYAPKTDGISLKNVFPFIAALGLYKIPVTVNFIANMANINEYDLREYFCDKLRGKEPVYYDGEVLSLKHDIIADLYFQAHKRERDPQYYLMEAIRYLDERLIIEYERYVLSAKIIRGTREIPHPSIDTVALLKAFEKNEPYIQCLKDNHRFYSYRVAKIFIITQVDSIHEEEFQNEWSRLLQETLGEEDLRLSTWINCFTASMELEFFPPDDFFSVTEYIGYRSITKHMSDFENYVENKKYNIFLYRRIARKTYESIANKYTWDIPSRLALIETMLEQNAVEDAEAYLEETLGKDIEGKYKFFVVYATFCKKRYWNLERKTRNIEKRKQKQKKASEAVKHSEGSLSAKKEEEADTCGIEPVKGEEKEKSGRLSLAQKRMYFLETAERYYRLAAELAPDNEKARPLCALGNFLQSTAGVSKDKRMKADRIKEAEDCFLKVIEMGDNAYSANNGLAMLYADTRKWNPCFNPEKADRCFGKAVEGCPKNRLVGCYVPWGNLHYNMGDLENAKEKYGFALKYKPDERKATIAIGLIEKEEYALERLLQEEPKKITDFKQLYIRKAGKRNTSHGKSRNRKKRNSADFQPKRQINKALFLDAAMQREILRLVYSALQSEDVTPETLEECKRAMANLSAVGGITADTEDENNLLYLRITQCLHNCCCKNNEAPYLELNRQQSLAHKLVLRYKIALG